MQAFLIIHNNYIGAVFNLKSTNTTEVSDCIIDGGIIKGVNLDGLTPQAQWIAIQLQASNTSSPLRGILENKFINMRIADANLQGNPLYIIFQLIEEILFMSQKNLITLT